MSDMSEKEASIKEEETYSAVFTPECKMSPNTDEDEPEEDPFRENFKDQFNISELPHYQDGSSNSSDSIGALTPAQSKMATEKKRDSMPSNSDVKKAKLLRNSGQSYTSQSKSKKNFEVRKMRQPCGEKCRLHCSEKISEANRQKLFDRFWSIGDLQRQREYIAASMVPIEPKYRYSSTQEFRKCNNAFHFMVDDNNVRVCKTFFASTLDINDRTIRTVISKKNTNGRVESDLRGKHNKHPTVSLEIKESVREFLGAIPRIESNDLRGHRSQANLYREYKELREKRNLPCAHPVMFNRFFNNEFNVQSADSVQKPTLNEAYYSQREEKELSSEKSLNSWDLNRCQYNAENRKLKQKQRDTNEVATTRWEYYNSLKFLPVANTTYTTIRGSSNLEPNTDDDGSHEYSDSWKKTNNKRPRMDSNWSNSPEGNDDDMEEEVTQYEHETYYINTAPSMSSTNSSANLSARKSTSSGPEIQSTSNSRINATATATTSTGVIADAPLQSTNSFSSKLTDTHQIFGDYVADQMRGMTAAKCKRLKLIIQRAILELEEESDDDPLRSSSVLVQMPTKSRGTEMSSLEIKEEQQDLYL